MSIFWDDWAYWTIDCSGLASQTVNGNRFSDPYTPDLRNQTSTGGIPRLYSQTTSPVAGNVILFHGHVGIVTSVDPLKFLGSQNKTGPAIVDTSDNKYWKGRLSEANYYKPCVPNDKPKGSKGSGGGGAGGGKVGLPWWWYATVTFNFWVGAITNDDPFKHNVQ